MNPRRNYTTFRWVCGCWLTSETFFRRRLMAGHQEREAGNDAAASTSSSPVGIGNERFWIGSSVLGHVSVGLGFGVRTVRLLEKATTWARSGTHEIQPPDPCFPRFRCVRQGRLYVHGRSFVRHVTMTEATCPERKPNCSTARDDEGAEKQTSLLRPHSRHALRPATLT
jgi:hypothetical protein